MHHFVSALPAALHACAVASLTLAAALARADGTPGNVDSGIRPGQCYASGSNALVGCDGSDIGGQDGQLGRDTYAATDNSSDGLLGLSFVRLCNDGEYAGKGLCPKVPALGEGVHDWGCVQDKLTGIMWEVKTAAGLRGRDLRYSNYSPQYDPLGEYASHTDATGYVADVNASNLCGFHDWGLAHTAKVQTILSYGVLGTTAPRVDLAFFPNTQADWYWNASPNHSAKNTAFAVNFGDGSVDNAADRATLRYAQVIRNAGQIVGPNGQYEISPDGIEAKDTTQTAVLVWRRCVEGMAWDGTTCTGPALTFTHEQALQRAAQQAAATGVAWRVPSVKELNWIVDREEPAPPIKHFVFPNTPGQPTWTSSPEVRKPKQAWAIDFSAGLVLQHARSEHLVLRLARDAGTP